jgi:Ca-activated chloride channel family protein
MPDGSPPKGVVTIERYCVDGAATPEAHTDAKTGKFLWTYEINPMTDRSCVLRAQLKGYASNTIAVGGFTWSSDPNLPPLVLTPGSNTTASEAKAPKGPNDAGVPVAVRDSWNSAEKAVQAKNWVAAEKQLRAVVQVAPQFAPGWNTLGLAYTYQQKMKEARDAFQHAVDADPKLQDAYLTLMRVSIELRDWDGVVKNGSQLIAREPDIHFPEIYTLLATAQYQLKDLPSAEKTIHEAILADKKHEVSRNEYVLGVILDRKQDYDGAREHLTRYLELEPKAEDAAEIQARIKNLGPGDADDIADLVIAPLHVTPPGEAWVPGGIKALTAVAHIKGTPAYPNFYSEYCRAIVQQTSIGADGIPQYSETLRAFMASVLELSAMGVRSGDNVTVTVSTATPESRKSAERILFLLGWKLAQHKDGTFGAEPGDLPSDALRQPVPGALGIDEIAMQNELDAGREFKFEVLSENARLIGGEAWSDLLHELPPLPGGLAAGFTQDIKMARVCAGLGAMGQDTAAALMSGVGLRPLVTKNAVEIARYGDSFVVSKGVVAVPGGSEAEPVWKELVGPSPTNAPAFLRALLEKQLGRLAAFYSVLSRADAAHQQFFTKNAKRADRFFAWYREGDEFRYGAARQTEGWRTELLQKLPLDESGSVRFPGGKRAWSQSATASDDDILLGLKTLEALVPIAEIEAQRKAPFDEASATLLAAHYSEWKVLFPYFAKLPGLGRQEFEALAAFADAAVKIPPANRNAVLGEWHALVELIARGVQAGSLDAATSARAFRSVCLGLAGADHSAKAVEALRQMAGGAGDMSEAVPVNLLRLTGERRFAFDRVMELQKVPRLEAATAAEPGRTATTLSGYVYAASLAPDGLLINEDSQLLSRHQFLAPAATEKRSMFAPAALVTSSTPPGSYISGGFMNFDAVVSGLTRGAKSSATPSAPIVESRADAGSTGPAAALSLAELQASTLVPDFRTNGRLVEVTATVTDGRGRYVDNLPVEQFSIVVNGQPQKVLAFESQFSEISCALLLDTTGSMRDALPALKNAALKMISDLRPEDFVAVYNFNKTVTELQPFTHDTAAAKRAVMSTYADGETAMFDALARVSHDLFDRAGKKVIVLFTDGNDNSSTLTADLAIQRAKGVGVPVYTIAQGEALLHPDYLKQMEGISKSTGGEAFKIQNPSEIAAVFEKISEDLAHGYLLSFQPPSVEDHAWRPIEVSVRGARGQKVRAREGYFPE